MKLSAIASRRIKNFKDFLHSLNDSNKGHSKPNSGGTSAGPPPPPQPRSPKE